MRARSPARRGRSHTYDDTTRMNFRRSARTSPAVLRKFARGGVGPEAGCAKARGTGRYADQIRRDKRHVAASFSATAHVRRVVDDLAGSGFAPTAVATQRHVDVKRVSHLVLLGGGLSRTPSTGATSASPPVRPTSSAPSAARSAWPSSAPSSPAGWARRRPIPRASRRRPTRSPTRCTPSSTSPPRSPRSRSSPCCSREVPLRGGRARAATRGRRRSPSPASSGRPRRGPGERGKAINWPRLSATPDSAEPARKTTIAVWKSRLQPSRSLSRPHRGIVTVAARRYAVTTQESWSMPPRSPTIVGSAVETIVWSSEARSIASSRPVKVSLEWLGAATRNILSL